MDFCGGLYVIYLYIFFCKPGNGFLEWVNRLEPYPILEGPHPGRKGAIVAHQDERVLPIEFVYIVDNLLCKD